MQRPFWAHQLVEYLVGIALISVAVQQPQPALPAILGVVVLLNAAIAKGAAGAFRLVGRRAHRVMDLVVIAALVIGAVQPWVSLDNVGRLALGGVAVVLLFVWFHTDFSERAPGRFGKRDAPADASRAAAPSTSTTGASNTDGTLSEEMGRRAGRVVGGGVNSVKRWKASFDEARNDEAGQDDAASREGRKADP